MTVVHVRLREWMAMGPNTLELRGADLGSADARALAARLWSAGIIEVHELRDGVHVQARAHVGRIKLGNISITVEPKIGISELLDLLRYAYGLRDLRRFDETDFAHTGELLQDLLAAQLLAEVLELVDRGLAKSYLSRVEGLASPRGRIDFAALAHHGPTVSAVLPCQHHWRSADHHLNRVARAGINLATEIAQEPGLRRSLRRLGVRLGAEIGTVRLSADSLARAKRQVNRLTAAYLPSIHLIELLYACAAVSLDGEAMTPLPGFLFDMNRFFQRLIGRFLTEYLTGYDVREEHALTEMMRYVPGHNPKRRRSPVPRPDFVIEHRSKPGCLLLDAKYRDLWERELPREMLYQLAIYALSQPTPSTATILFPTAAAEATSAIVEIRDPARNGPLAYVELRPVILSELVRVLARPLVEREHFARVLAFGRDTNATPPLRQTEASRGPR